MKNLLLTLLLCLPMLAFAQDLPKDPETGLITYTEVVPVEGVSQQELYKRARSWFATTFHSANDVVQLESKDEGKIIGKGIAVINIGNLPSDMHFTLTLQFKDNRYRYEFTQIAFNSGGDTKRWPMEGMFFNDHARKKNGQYTKLHQSYLDQTNSAIASMVTSLNKELTGSNSANEDW